jgi:pimeloyl-ACP methyl ester carboxylesterase
MAHMNGRIDVLGEHFRIEWRSTLSNGWSLAATVHLPRPELLQARPILLICMPGSGYNRHYYDLREPGYSEAEQHVAAGMIVVALDALGVGDSSIPPFDESDKAAVAKTTDETVKQLLEALTNGTLCSEFPAIARPVTIGIGQSMSGFIVAATQGLHSTFDGIAILGASMIAITMPLPDGQKPVVPPEGITGEESALYLLENTDWKYVFHWEDVPQHFLDADMEGGLPLRRTAPYWGSLTSPGITMITTLPNAVADETARIVVPVLVAMGERDVTKDPLEELAAFPLARDRAAFVVERMAHMHNFAGTRHLLWSRIESFAKHVADLRAINSDEPALAEPRPSHIDRIIA